MNKKNIIFIAILGIIILAYLGYNYQKKQTNKINSMETISITHGLGETNRPKNPKNIVVFDYGILDTLDTLNIPVIGVSKKSLPKMLSKYNDSAYTDIGDLKEPNMETLKKLNPDIIFISARQADIYDELSAIAPTIYLSIESDSYMDSFTKNMNIIGTIFHKENKIAEELSLINKEIAEIKKMAEAKNQSALIILANEGKYSVYGKKSRFGFIHNELGIPTADETIKDSTHGQKASFEYLLNVNPSYIYVVDRGIATGKNASAEKIFENDLGKQLIAYKEKHIYYLDASVWYFSTGGINTTKHMIQEIKNSLK